MSSLNFRFIPIAGMILVFIPVLGVLAQNETDYYGSVANSCRFFLESSRVNTRLWSDINASAVKDTGSTSGNAYNKRIAEHCEWNLRSDKPSWNQIRDRAISSLPIPDQSFYQKRVAAHCEWILKNTNADWWRSVRDSAIKDAGNANSDFYYKRVGEHCESLLTRRNQVGKWNQVVLSAKRDVFASIVK